MEIYTNGLYIIEASLSKHRNPKNRVLKGHIIDINNSSKRVTGAIYRIGSKIEFPLYHTKKHKEPQFKRLETIREEKIDSILND